MCSASSQTQSDRSHRTMILHNASKSLDVTPALQPVFVLLVKWSHSAWNYRSSLTLTLNDYCNIICQYYHSENAQSTIQTHHILSSTLPTPHSCMGRGICVSCSQLEGNNRCNMHEKIACWNPEKPEMPKKSCTLRICAVCVLSFVHTETSQFQFLLVSSLWWS